MPVTTTLAPEHEWMKSFLQLKSPDASEFVEQTHLESMRVIVNPEIRTLMKEHIALTMRLGTDVEKKAYWVQVFRNNDLSGYDDAKSGFSTISTDHIQDQTVEHFIRRLINKRPAAFVGGLDDTTLRNKESRDDEFFNLHLKDNSKKDSDSFCFDNYISYDEMKFSAYLHLSSETPFINDGNRHNNGYLGQAGTFVSEGVVIGSVGARFERPGLMEDQDVMINSNPQLSRMNLQPDAERKPYSEAQKKMWANFYGSKLEYTPIDLSDTAKFVQDSKGDYFNKEVYKKILKYRLSAVLSEANSRAINHPQGAYVHLVGLGLGVWAVKGPAAADEQSALYKEVILDLLRTMDLPHVARVHYGNYSDLTSDAQDVTFDKKKVVFSERYTEPSAESVDKKDLLLVQDFAWASNSFGGNEYWNGALTLSGDPAAACSAPAVRYFNGVLNPFLLEQVPVVSCDALTVADSAQQQSQRHTLMAEAAERRQEELDLKRTYAEAAERMPQEQPKLKKRQTEAVIAAAKAAERRQQEQLDLDLDLDLKRTHAEAAERMPQEQPELKRTQTEAVIAAAKAAERRRQEQLEQLKLKKTREEEPVIAGADTNGRLMKLKCALDSYLALRQVGAFRLLGYRLLGWVGLSIRFELVKKVTQYLKAVNELLQKMNDSQRSIEPGAQLLKDEVEFANYRSDESLKDYIKGQLLTFGSKTKRFGVLERQLNKVFEKEIFPAPKSKVSPK